MEDTSVKTQIAKDLLRSFVHSQTPNDFCRNLVHVVLRDSSALSCFIFRVDDDSTIRWLGQYGFPGEKAALEVKSVWRAGPLTEAIKTGRPVLIDSRGLAAHDYPKGFEYVGEGLIALPFDSNGALLGALCLIFEKPLGEVRLANGDLELIQLFAEQMAVNELTRAGSFGTLLFRENDGKRSIISERQISILDQMAIGKTNFQIGRDLNLSESSIKQESVRIFKFLGARTRQEAVKVAKEIGII